MNVGEKIKFLRKKHHMTQADLAKLLNVATTSVSAWEGNKNRPLMDKLTAIAEIFDVPIGVFFTPDLPSLQNYRTDIENINEESLVKIPVIQAPSHVYPMHIEERFTDYEYECKEKIPNGNLFYLYVSDDCMEPRIPKGSRVLILQQNDLEDHTIVAVRMVENGRITLKRVRVQPEYTILAANNLQYAPMLYKEGCDLEVIGKVIRIVIDL